MRAISNVHWSLSKLLGVSTFSFLFLSLIKRDCLSAPWVENILSIWNIHRSGDNKYILTNLWSFQHSIFGTFAFLLYCMNRVGSLSKYDRKGTASTGCDGCFCENSQLRNKAPTDVWESPKIHLWHTQAEVNRKDRAITYSPCWFFLRSLCWYL